MSKLNKVLQKLLYFPTLTGEKTINLGLMVINPFNKILKQLIKKTKLNHVLDKILDKYKANPTAKFKLKKLTYFALAILILFGPLAYFISKKPNSAQASWWNDSWLYRKKVSITNSGSAQTDFQIAITLDTAALITASKMQSDCDDIRITDINGKVLDHWVEKNTNNSCNTSSTLIWTKVPSIPTSGTTVYIYYGNPSTPTNENGQDTFPDYFEDFSEYSNDTDITSVEDNWSKDTDYSSAYTIDSGRLKMFHPASAPNEARDGAIYTFDSEITTDFAVDADVTIADSNNWDFLMIVADSGWTDMTSSHTYTALWSSINNETWYGWKDGWLTAQSGLTIGNTYHLATTFEISNDLSKMYVDGSYKIDRTFPDTGTTGLKKIAFGNYGYSSLDAIWYVDNIRLRKHTPTPPTVATPGTEETTPGPIAYWKFDEGYGATAYDSTQNNKDGTFLSAPVWKSEEYCVSGKCLSFDNIDDGVSIANENFTSLTDYTMEAWINLKGNHKNYTGTIMSSGDWNNTHWAFGIDQDNSGIDLRKPDGTNQPPEKAYAFELNKWTHVAITRSGTTITYYVDGQSIGTYTGTTGNIISNASNTAIGRETYAGGYFAFNGWIDEPKIYSYARSAEQIKQDSQPQSASQGTSAVLGVSKDQGDFLSEGLVGYWNMDAGIGATAPDLSGNGNTGVLTNGPAWSAGKYGNSVEILGDDDVIDISDVSGSNLTASLWYYYEGIGAGSWNTLLCRDDGTYHHLLINDSSQEIGFYNGSWSSSGYALTQDTWYYLTLVKSGTNSKLYVNGELKQDSDSSFDNNTYPLSRIGNYGSNSQGAIGKIDEVRIYNRAFSPQEVKDLYNWAPGPVAYYNFDEKSTSTAYDSSGNGNNLTATGFDSSNIVHGKYGGAYYYNTWEERQSGTSTNLSTYATLEAWVYPKSTPSERYTIVIQGGTNAIYLSYGSDNAVHTYWAAKSSPGYHSSGSNTVPLNQWSYVTAVWDSTGAKLYVNGILKNSVNSTGTNSSGTTLRIGAENSGRQMDGYIDEVKIYNYARSSKQIVEDMNASHPIGGSPVGSQVGWWKFDEGYGATPSDSSNNNNHAASFTGTPTWTNQGKFGKALSFNGSDVAGDYVTIPYDDSINIFAGTNWTITMWLKPDSGVSSAATIIQGTSHKPRIYVNSTTVVYQGYVSSVFTTIVSSGGITAEQWNHVTITCNGTNCKIYVNGQQKASAAFQQLDSPFGALRIGATGWATENFQGEADEIKFYNSALTEDEIKIDMNGGSVLGVANGIDEDINDNPSGYWKLDEISGTNAKDFSFNNNNGILGGGTSSYIPSWTSAKIFNGVSFDGNDYIDVTDSTSVRPSTAITMESWVYYPASASNACFLCKQYGSGSGNSYALWVSSDTLYSGINLPTCSAVNHGSMPANQWVHLATTWDANSDTITTYINGEANGTTGTCTSAFISYDSNGFFIGADDNNVDNIPDFWNSNGIIQDEVKIYNYARSATQVKADASTDQNNPTRAGAPIAEWKMDEKNGSTTYDTSGNGHTATLQNMEASDWKSSAECYSGSCLNFNASGERITIASPIGQSGYTTASLWYKRDENSASGSWRTLLGDASANIHHLIIHSTSRNIGIFDGSWRDFGYNPPNDGKWHHYEVIYNSASTATLYVDGVYQNQIAIALNLSTYPIGSIGNWGSNTYWAGPIDQVKIYDYARTPAQIAYDFNRGKPIIHYHMDENQGTTLNDAEASDGSQNGTITGGGIWVGQSNQAEGTGKYSSSFQAAEATTNMVTNPSFETGTSGWSATNATLAQVSSGTNSDFTKYGSYYLSITPGSTSYTQATAGISGFSAGQTYSFSVYVDKGSYSGNLYVTLKDYNGVDWQATQTPVTTTGRYTATRTIRADATNVQVAVDGSGGTGIYYFDANQVEQKAYSTPYCDGSLGNGHSWSGTAHASTSSRTAGYAYETGFDYNDIASAGTISTWLYKEKDFADAVNFDRYWEIDNSKVQLLISPGNHMYAYYTGPSTYVTLGSTPVNDTFWPINTWMHFTLTWEVNGNNTTLKLYANAKLVDQATADTGGAYTGSTGLYLGNGNGVYQANTLLDDFRVYTYVLNEDQIKTIYNQGSSVSFSD